MRIGQYRTDGTEAPWVGMRLDEETVLRLREAGTEAGVDIPKTTVDLLAGWEWQEKVELAVEYARETRTGL